MFLTDNVEVFVIKSNGGINDFSSECRSKEEFIGSSRQSFLAVDDNQGYSVAIVFGQNFNMSPRVVDKKLDRKVSACRIRVSIDGGLAVAERVFKLPDLEKRPSVQNIDVFKVAVSSASHKLKNFTVKFMEVPDDNVYRAKMSTELRKKISHIDVQLERGYLDFDLQGQAFQPTSIAGGTNTQLSAARKHVTPFRTRCAKAKGSDFDDLKGPRFVAREEPHRMRITYIASALVQQGLSKGRIIERARSKEWTEAVRAIEHGIQFPSSSLPNEHAITDVAAPKRSWTEIPLPSPKSGSTKTAKTTKDDSVQKPTIPLSDAPTPKKTKKVKDAVAQTPVSKKRKNEDALEPTSAKKSKKARKTGHNVPETAGEKRLHAQQQPIHASDEPWAKLKPFAETQMKPTPRAVDSAQPSDSDDSEDDWPTSMLKIKQEKLETPVQDTPSQPEKKKKLGLIDLTMVSSDESSSEPSSDASDDDDSSSDDEPIALSKARIDAEVQRRLAHARAQTAAPANVRAQASQENMPTPTKLVSAKSNAPAPKSAAEKKSEPARRARAATAAPQTATPASQSTPKKGNEQQKPGTASGASMNPTNTTTTSSPFAAPSLSSFGQKTSPIFGTPATSFGSTPFGVDREVHLPLGLPTQGILPASRLFNVLGAAPTAPSEAPSFFAMADNDIKLLVARQGYNIVLAETTGKGDSDETVRKRIEMRQAQVELAQREIRVLQAKLNRDQNKAGN